MVTTAVEVERKYDVGLDVEVPDLVGVGGAATVARDTFRLDATYLDTEDLRLRAARTTLRRRSGGPDEGWHLKLPHGGDVLAHSGDREEVRVDGPPGEDLPEALRVLVRSRTRALPLLPVARLETTRRVHRLVDAGGRVLAEVADDLVVGTSLAGPGGAADELRWREWEVELVEGPRGLLDEVQERLLAAGAVPSDSASKVGRVLARRSTADGRPPWWASHARSPQRGAPGHRAAAGEVLLAHVAAQVEELLGQDPRVRRDQPDAVHKMRVATRRLRSALGTFRPLLDRERTDPLRDELRWLAGELGEVRDTEVLHERLRRLVAEQDPALVVGPVAARVDTELDARYRTAHDRVLAELESDRYVALLDALVALLEAPPLHRWRGAGRRRAAPLVRRALAAARPGDARGGAGRGRRAGPAAARGAQGRQAGPLRRRGGRRRLRPSGAEVGQGPDPAAGGARRAPGRRRAARAPRRAGRGGAGRR